MASFVTASVELATEALRPNSAQEPRFNIQRTSVSLRSEQVDDVECYGLLIVSRDSAFLEDILV